MWVTCQINYILNETSTKSQWTQLAHLVNIIFPAKFKTVTLKHF